MKREPTRDARRRKRRAIRRLIPVAIAVFLIFIVVMVALAADLWKKFSYSKERADLNEYFGVEDASYAAIMMQDEYINEKAIIQDGRYYVSSKLAEDNFCSGFYYDEFEDELLHTTATRTIVSTAEDGDFLVRDGALYLALDYLSKLVNLEVNVFEGEVPHIEIRYEWGEEKKADIKKSTSARILGGVKSEILTDLDSGDTVVVMDEMETWSRVKTPDGYIGYVENKYLKDIREETQTPVTEVAKEPIVHNIRDHRICLGWHQVMSREANPTLYDVIENTKGLNVISPTWFSLMDNAGGISDIGSSEYVKRAHEKGLEVWALVDNFNKDVSTYEVLRRTSVRKILTGNLINAATALGCDGINIDFENLSEQCGPAFAQFIRELSVACRKEGLVLSVDNYVPREYTSFYDRKTQGQYADYVIIMGYDEHYASSKEAGSVASFNFVQEGIERTLSDVDPSQVINGIPFYTRIWHQGTSLESEAVDMQTALDYVKNHGMTPVWDDTCAQNYAEKTEGSIIHRVWLEDAQSVKAKLDLMNANSLAGAACWKLGFETPDVWDVIEAYMNE